MRLKTVRAGQALGWIGAGWRAFGQAPLAWSGLLALAGLAFVLLMALPLIGPVLALGLVPGVGWAFTAAGRALAETGHIPPGAWWRPLRADPAAAKRLLALAGAYALAALAAGLLADALDGGRFQALTEQVARSGGELPQDAGLDGMDGPILLRLALLGTVSLLFWHAPPLVVWGGQGVGAALFGSAVAAWRGLGAYLLLGLGWALLMVGLLSLGQVLLLSLGMPQGAALFVMPAGMIVATAFYASLWRIYADSFEEPGPR